MGSITKPTIDMINGGAAIGDVESTGKGLTVTPNNRIANELSGTFDSTAGVLRLSIPGYPELTITNFMTQSDIGTGKEGPQGLGGTPGADGLIGESGLKGQRGCQGPRGPQGERGVRGPEGKKGEQGPIGPTGAEGPKGEDGRVLIFISNEDPGPRGPGAIWIKPQ